jgi:hypothetical protein
VQVVGNATVADHLAVVAKIKGRKLDENAPQLPREMRYLWGIFLSLHNRRGSNGFGPTPLAWSEMEAFCRLTGTPLDPWEVEAICALDEAYLDASESVTDVGAAHG